MPKRKIVENPPYLDDEEREMIESIDWDTVELLTGEAFEARKKELQQIAENTLRQMADVQVSTLLPRLDLSKLNGIADRKGVSLQTLLGSILHQYAEGRLKEVEPGE